MKQEDEGCDVDESGDLPVYTRHEAYGNIGCVLSGDILKRKFIRIKMNFLMISALLIKKRSRHSMMQAAATCN
ncbi:hypothetical protein BCI9360_00052 [Bacillus sp. CECT 9360]|nr:hypothetical protein BCI9360_00052 [Bacillus sp. CECT 9360]